MKKASELGKVAVAKYKSEPDKGIVFHERYLGLKESEQRKIGF